MSKPIPHSELEEMINKISKVPEPDAEFMNSLRARFILEGHASAKQNQEKKMKRNKLSPRLAWGLALLVLAALLTLAFTSPPVANALRHLFGYIPGVGLVEQGSSLRVLEEPFTVERDGISLKIEQVAASADKTIIVYNYIVPPVDTSAYQLPVNPNPSGPTLVLPDGSRLDAWFERRFEVDGLPTDKGDPIRSSLEFPPLPANVMEVTLELSYLPGIPSGFDPKARQIPLKLKLAPQGTILPVIEVTETGAGNGSVAEATPSPEPAGTVSPHGIRMSLDSYVPMDDGYLIIGSLQWDEQSFPAATLNGFSIGVKPGPYSLRVVDSNGQEIPFEFVSGPETPVDEAYRFHWAIKVPGKGFQPPLTINLEGVEVQLHPVSFSVNAGATPLDGQVIEINQDLQIADSTVHIQKAQLLKRPDGTMGFLFDMQVEPSQVGDVNLALIGSQCMGGGGGYPAEHLSLIQTIADSCMQNLPPDPLKIQAVRAVLWGPWQVEWTPAETLSVAPPTPTTTPLSRSEACLSMDKFKQALSEKPPLPEGFGGKVILYGPYQGNNSIWKTTLVNLDGSNPQVLGDGDGNFSPDGTKVAFSRTMEEKDKQGIYITDFMTGETVRLLATGQGDFNPMWSPDGSQIVFNRGMGLFELYAINADGSNLRRLTYDQGQEFAIGWMPGGQQLLYTLPGKAYEYTDHIVDVQTGKIEYFSNEELMAMSPDAKYIITAERDPANMDAWTSYYSNLDGSNRWALADSSIVVQYPIWGANGEWLLVSLSKLYDDKQTPAFIHLTDCQIIPLPKLNGIVIDWLP